jgi:hypothetical protein
MLNVIVKLRNSKTVKDELVQNKVRDIKDALTVQVLVKYLRFWDHIQVHLSSLESDHFVCRWLSIVLCGILGMLHLPRFIS